jgi:hypothetical protein
MKPLLLSSFSDFTPNLPAIELKTVQDLKSWMKENGCNFLSYDIDSGPIYEGFILAPAGSSFFWFYTERGVETPLKVFRKEADAVAYAYDHIRNDGWAWSHMVGFTSDKTILEQLTSCLEMRNVAYYVDKIPYNGPSDVRYRVFVHGSNAELVSDLETQFGEQRS